MGIDKVGGDKEEGPQTALGHLTSGIEPGKLEEFLIAEYNQVFLELRRIRAEGITRLNFFVTLSTGVLGGVVFFIQLSSLSLLARQLLAALAVSLLLLLGWDVYRYLIFRDTSSDFNMRALGRIRRFFIDRQPSAARYFIWNADDEPSLYVKRKDQSSIITTMSYFLGGLCGIDVGILLSIGVSQVWVIFGAGVIVALLSIASLQIYARRRIREAYREASESVMFRKMQATPHGDAGS
jgi:hypothetical protein